MAYVEVLYVEAEVEMWGEDDQGFVEAYRAEGWRLEFDPVGQSQTRSDGMYWS